MFDDETQMKQDEYQHTVQLRNTENVTRTDLTLHLEKQPLQQSKLTS